MTQDPVRPPPPSEPGGGAAGTASSGQGPEEVNLKEAIMDDPIIGVEQQDEGAIEAKPLRSPPVMTPAQREIHNLTHQPPHPGCEICRATRTPNIPHTLSLSLSRTQSNKSYACGRLLFLKEWRGEEAPDMFGYEAVPVENLPRLWSAQEGH